jgi:uncharacterized protein (DUF1800 family)
MAKVFTGLSWYHANPTNSTFFGIGDSNQNINRPMIGYPNFHSTSEKKFLGTTIPASSTANVMGDINTALDVLFNHPNAGPFFAKRMIQQLVTSNPSPAYVGRVAAVFANNGSSVRGDMGAVIRAILLDTEARDTAAAQANASYGKLREPVIRLTNWARAFEATSFSGKWLIQDTSANTSLNQSALAAPSVFNFWRPGYIPPETTQAGQRNLAAPEFQIVDEVTVASYINLMEATIDRGIGWTPAGASSEDVSSDFDKEIALATNPGALLDRLNLLLFYGQMSSRLRGILNDQINSITVPAGAQEAEPKEFRAKLSVLMSMISPEYLVQR